MLLLTTGAELSGRVLSITPTELTYLPAPTAGEPAKTDTLHLPAASVFLVRYANGTREVLSSLAAPAPPDATPPALRGLSDLQRRRLGQRDAQGYYRSSEPGLATVASTLYLGPLFGLIPTIAIADKKARPQNLHAPQPQLLADPAYAQGYQQQANRLKKRRVWTSYGAVSAAYLLLLAASLASLH